MLSHCLLYTSDAADDLTRVDLGGRRIIKKNFFKQKTAYEITTRLVGSEMCIRDRHAAVPAAEAADRLAARELLNVIALARRAHERTPVSYTHLTLPTILRV